MNKANNNQKQPKYLIEIRLFGNLRYQVKKLGIRLTKLFGLPPTKKIPHITLLGPFDTLNEGKLISDFEDLCKIQREYMNYEVMGFGRFKPSVVYAKVKSDEKLNNFRLNLIEKLSPYCSGKNFREDYVLHATIVKRMPALKSYAIMTYLSLFKSIRIKNKVMRITLLKNAKILKEYDFSLNLLLNRNLALDKNILSKSFDKIQSE